MTIFLGCGFAAKYLEGGGNFSVPLQWMLGLKRLNLDAVWLELLPTSGNIAEDHAKIQHFQKLLREHGLAGRYCLLYQTPSSDQHNLDTIECIGMTREKLRERLGGPNTLLNLSYSIHPPFLLEFERRIFCDLDPSELQYWMTKMDLGQSNHHEFCTIGLNVNSPDCRLPRAAPIQWRTFYPLVDTELFQPKPKPRALKFTTIGQWYWDGAVEVDGEYPDLSKKHAFEPYLDLPKRVPEVKFELAVNFGADVAERERLQGRGWNVVDPHDAARTPQVYRRYLAGAAGEFTAIKGVDVLWRTGWLSDRAAAFLAMGRPVITEETGGSRYLPDASGFQFVGGLEEAVAAAKAISSDWKAYSDAARTCAVELFDSVKNLRKILQLSG